MLDRTHVMAGLRAALLALIFAPAGAGARPSPQWNESLEVELSTVNCSVLASPYIEKLSGSTVAWYGDPSNPPALGEVYYVKVAWSVLSPGCGAGGAYVAPELFLPDGTSLAISAATPVRCFLQRFPFNSAPLTMTELTDGSCPQAPQVGSRNGLAFYPVGEPRLAWPTPVTSTYASGYAITVPVVSTAPLSGAVTSINPFTPCPSCLTAAVWFKDGLNDPWAFPRRGVNVQRPFGGGAVSTITYPAPSTTAVTTTTATGTAILDRAGTTGTAFIEESVSPSSSAACNQSRPGSLWSPPIAIEAFHPAVSTITIPFVDEQPGSTVYWRVCYVTSGGVTTWGSTQSFTTASPPEPPRLLLPGVPYGRWFGGSLEGQSFSYSTPDVCQPGFIRSGSPQTSWSSATGGSCSFDGWVAPDDLNDCRAFIKVHTGGFGAAGSCFSTVMQEQKPAPMNLAALRPATQSSTGWGGDASRAVDGNTDGDWSHGSVTHTGLGGGWWQVDLGSVKEIGEVVLYNRTDAYSGRLADFDVEVSNDASDGSWRIAATHGGPAAARAALSTYTTGRFVRVRLRGSDYLSLAEVQVFAPRDLAAFKRATQTSPLDEATAAVDGVVRGRAGTTLVPQSSWQVDLGAVTDIADVVITKNHEGADFAIQLSDDGVTFEKTIQLSGLSPTRTVVAVNRAARFVRLQNGAVNLGLLEVEVLGPQNLAAGRKTQQSSTGWGGDAARAVDGNSDGDWNHGSVTHTAVEPQPWWQVDLGTATNIGEVALYNRTDCCSDRLANFDVQLSNDGVVWYDTAHQAGISGVRSAFQIPAVVRFIRVRLRGIQALSLAEVRVLPSRTL